MPVLRIDHTKLTKLAVHDIRVKRLHDVFVGARCQRFLNMFNVILRRAENNDRNVPARHPAQQAKEFHAVHDRHIPVQQHDIRHFFLAGFEGFFTVFSLLATKAYGVKYLPGYFAYDPAVVNKKTCFH